MTESLDDRRRQANELAEANFVRLQAAMSDALDAGDIATARELEVQAKAANDRYFATLTEAQRIARFETIQEES